MVNGLTLVMRGAIKSDIHSRAFLAASVYECEQGTCMDNGLTLVKRGVTKSDIHPVHFSRHLCVLVNRILLRLTAVHWLYGV